MAKELAFVLINPYSIAKSRTGGVIARCIGRTNLDLVAARMFGPSEELATRYAELVRCGEGEGEIPETRVLLADYVRRNYAPDPATGRTRRVLLLVFEGEDAVHKIWTAAGGATLRQGVGETIRETYGDYILDEQNRVKYFEPAVLVGPTKAEVESALVLWASYSEREGGIVGSAMDVPHGQDVEQTLVLLKPDNFRFPSFRPGNIVDLLSSSALRIVGVKKFRMTVAQAEAFYEPVRETLRRKFLEISPKRAAGALAKEFAFEVPEESTADLCERLAPIFAGREFENIVKFMTGYRPSECPPTEKAALGKEECLALVYEGVDAVRKIRNILGPTDPSKASPGSVRREFGSDIMVNAAHASDSTEAARREMGIIRIEEDTVKPLVERYFGKPAGQEGG